MDALWREPPEIQQRISFQAYVEGAASRLKYPASGSEQETICPAGEGDRETNHLASKANKYRKIYIWRAKESEERCARWLRGGVVTIY